ncbi:MAG: response regulator [Lachnospiraceae bacterium]|nr:response regulator [Lachnospiraceae bacterium]
MTGHKETFLARVLVKKLQDAGLDCVFVPWTVDSINQAWEGTGLVILYMDEGEQPAQDVLHFLTDKMGEEDLHLVTVGEKEEVEYVASHFSEDMLYRSFIRPIDNEEFVKTVTEHMKQLARGEFKRSILVVDDDANYLGLVREWLKGTYKVSMVNSGLQAIKFLAKNKVDLILLDHEMPVTSGPQVLEMLRSEEETKNIPVIFLTGKSDKESVMAVVALKPEGYFLKSIGREELLEKINEFFILHR